MSLVDTSGSKSIKLYGSNTRLHADIVPALQHRIYTSFVSMKDSFFLPGIKFKATDGTEIENFPKLHKLHGKNKNSEDAAGEHYKHLVRVIKNIRRQLVEDKLITKDLAPSYFIECLVFNVPDDYFTDNYQVSIQGILRFLLHEYNADLLLAGNRMHSLFGDKPWQWNSKDDAALFLNHVNNFLGIDQ